MHLNLSAPKMSSLSFTSSSSSSFYYPVMTQKFLRCMIKISWEVTQQILQEIRPPLTWMISWEDCEFMIRGKLPGNQVLRCNHFIFNVMLHPAHSVLTASGLISQSRLWTMNMSGGRVRGAVLAINSFNFRSCYRGGKVYYLAKNWSSRTFLIKFGVMKSIWNT